MEIPEFARKAIDKSKAVASDVAGRWSQKTPGEKAAFVTTAAVLTIINPLLPVVYGAVYTQAASSKKDTD